MNYKQPNSPWKQHLHSTFVSAVCLGTAATITLLYRSFAPGSTCALPFFFLLAVVTVTRHSVSLWYGLSCCLLSVVCLHFLGNHTRPFLQILLTDYIPAVLIMGSISVQIHTILSHLTVQADILTESEKLCNENEQEKMRANLLRAISHDLRTPLSGIISNSSWILENEGQLSEEETRKMVSNIYDSSNWLLNMVDNLLTITRITDEGPTITIHSEPVEEVVSETLQKIAKRYPDVKIHAKVPEEILLLPMDATLIEQVSINLLSNAILHSESVRPIDWIVRSTPHTVIFTIRDYGRGISPEYMNHLFDSTSCAPVSSAGNHKGKGIGLSICKTIISAHHGTLIGRNHAEGAEFIFTLPKDT